MLLSRGQRLNGFQQGSADWLVSIDMCAEGFDAPRIRVVAYLVIARDIDHTRSRQRTVPRHASFVFAPLN